jgi:hypothetical protein
MRIGFVKLGLKTYFNKNGTGQGSNHELVSIFNLFKEKGHDCFMLSFNDKYEEYKEVDKLDFIFVFNGFLPNTLETNMNMLKQPIEMIKLINSCDTPYAYFWTDMRYNIRENKIIRQPDLILSQEKEYYGHLEKIILIGKNKNDIKEKDIKFGVLMNSTSNKRDKEILNFLSWLEFGEIRGDWKKKENKFFKEPVKEDEINDYLSKVKYTLNITTNSDWINQKYYEYILNNVICFQYKSDLNNLVMEENDYRRVKDEIDLDEKIEQLEKAKDLYNEILEKQKNELKEEYFNGEFIYQFIINKINKK